jgi:hypothetical protein
LKKLPHSLSKNKEKGDFIVDSFGLWFISQNTTQTTHKHNNPSFSNQPLHTTLLLSSTKSSQAATLKQPKTIKKKGTLDPIYLPKKEILSLYLFWIKTKTFLFSNIYVYMLYISHSFNRKIRKVFSSNLKTWFLKYFNICFVF